LRLAILRHLGFEEHLRLDGCSVLFSFLLACAAATASDIIILANVLLRVVVVVVRVLFGMMYTMVGLLRAAHRLKTGLGDTW